MGQLLRICMDLSENEIDWQVLYNKFDSRNGFQMVTLGIDYHEDCELLKQISKALDFKFEVSEAIKTVIGNLPKNYGRAINGTKCDL